MTAKKKTKRYSECHYVDIAKIIADCSSSVTYDQQRAIALRFASLFVDDAPETFDRAKFLRACNID